MTTDRGNPEETGIEQDDEPLDPDIVLITNYLAEELSAEQEAEVDERLVEDEAFYEKVVPYMRIWTEPVDYRKELETWESEQRAASSVAAEPGRVSEAGYRTGRSRGQVRLSRLLKTAQVSSLVAAALLLIVGVPSIIYQVGFSNGREEEISRSPATTPATVVENGITKARVEPEARTVKVGNSTFLRLRAGSRFAQQSVPIAFQEVVGLSGEAYIDVGWFDSKVTLATHAGMVVLRHGTYAVRASVEPNEETLVTVGSGVATLKGSDGGPDLKLYAGEHGRVAYPAPPQRTKGGAGYPALDPTERAKP